MILTISELLNLPVGAVFRTKSGSIGEIVEDEDETAYIVTGIETFFDLEWVDLPAEIIYLPLVPDPRDDV